MSNTVKSFHKKKGPKFPEIPGTRISIQNHQLISSSGIPSLDSILGGGFVVGSVILVQDDSDLGQDFPVEYGKVLMKYFLSCGIFHEQALFFASCDLENKEFLHNLPDVMKKIDSKERLKNENSGYKGKSEDHLKIAWRYKNVKTSGDTSAQASSETDDIAFNLQMNIAKDKLEKCLSYSWRPDLEDISGEKVELHSLFETLKSLQTENEIFDFKKKSETKSLRRIAIHGLESGMWTNVEHDEESRCLERTKFLLALKSLMRSTLGISVISVKSQNFSDKTMNRLHQCVDHVISLKTFSAETRKQPMFKDYHGFLEILKATNFGGLAFPKCFGKKFIFRSLKTKFVIETIHLPPDIGEENNVEESKKKSNIDF